MPIYEFKCNDCGFVFETFLLKSDEEVNCIKCKSKNVVKLISAPYLGGNSNSNAGSACGGGRSSGFS